MIRRHLRAVTRSLLPGGDLETRTVRSGVWLTALNVSRRALELLALLVLARLLTPDDFGLLGIALLTLTGLERFSNLGLTSALIQRAEDDVDQYLDSAFTLQVARGLLLAALVVALAGPAATFFGEPAVRPILIVVALTPILTALENPGCIYFQKDLEFHKQFVFLLSTSLSYVIVTIALAFVLGNVWAMVFGKVVSEAVQTVVSYLIHDFRPSLSFEREPAMALINYGKWLTASGFIYFLADEGDDFVVGWLLSAASLGFYRLAYRLALTPVSEVTGVVSTVMFPAYSKIQDDIPAIRSGFLRTLQLTTALTLPIGAGIIAVAPVFVEGVLGAQWTPMVIALQILALYGVFVSVTASFHPVWLAIGHPDYGAKIGLVRVIVMAAVIYPATIRYGLLGTGGSVLFAYVVGGLPLDLYLARSQLELSLGRFFGVLAYPTAAAGAMGAVVWVVRDTVDLGLPLVELAVLVALGVVCYVAFGLALARGVGWGIEGDIRRLAGAFGD